MNDEGTKPTAGRDAGPAPADGPASGRRGRRRRRGPVLGGVAILLVAGATAVGAMGLGGGDGTDDDGRAPGRSGQTVPVARSTLVDRTEVDGRLGHGPEVPFQIKSEGTVTWLPEAGSTIRRGKTVLRVDDRPVVLMYGSLPMYRGLGMTEPEPEPESEAPEAGAAGDDGRTGGTGAQKTGGAGSSGQEGDAGARQQPARQAPAPLRGMDVKQFETNLSALGYSGFTVDDSYTAGTADAVKRWQKKLGLPQTGSVGAGDIVYAPGPVRIAGTGVRVGASAAGNPLSYTSTSRMVTVDAPAADMNWAERGNGVTVELPDGRSVKGEVTRVGKDAAAPATGEGGEGEGGSGQRPATVSVVVGFDDEDAVGRMESGPVTVRYVVSERKNVLTVPVAALVALAEGGHGLEPAGGSGDGAAGGFVPVTTGLFADGKVEVSGPGVREGMKVRIPE